MACRGREPPGGYTEHRALETAGCLRYLRNNSKRRCGEELGEWSVSRTQCEQRKMVGRRLEITKGEFSEALDVMVMVQDSIVNAFSPLLSLTCDVPLF